MSSSYTDSMPLAGHKLLSVPLDCPLPFRSTHRVSYRVRCALCAADGGCSAMGNMISNAWIVRNNTSATILQRLRAALENRAETRLGS